MASTVVVHAQRVPIIAPRSPTRLTVPSMLENSVSVVIPCRNEEMNVCSLVRALISYYDICIYEIILVDDGSTDKTYQRMKDLAEGDSRIKPIRRTPPHGVGCALMEGYNVAQGQWVLSIDCDFQHLVPELRDLFDAAEEGFDVVVGSRFSDHSIVLDYPMNKLILNRIYHLISRLFLVIYCRDLTNNLKLIRRSVIESLKLREPHFAVNAEVGFQPLLLGYRIKEIPVSWTGRKFDMGVSSFRLLRVSIGYMRVLWNLCLWRYFNIGSYRDLQFSPSARDQRAEGTLRWRRRTNTQVGR